MKMIRTLTKHTLLTLLGPDWEWPQLKKDGIGFDLDVSLSTESARAYAQTNLDLVCFSADLQRTS
jgi:hypothetical protein